MQGRHPTSARLKLLQVVSGTVLVSLHRTLLMKIYVDGYFVLNTRWVSILSADLTLTMMVEGNWCETPYTGWRRR